MIFNEKTALSNALLLLIYVLDVFYGWRENGLDDGWLI